MYFPVERFDWKLGSKHNQYDAAPDLDADVELLGSGLRSHSHFSSLSDAPIEEDEREHRDSPTNSPSVRQPSPSQSPSSTPSALTLRPARPSHVSPRKRPAAESSAVQDRPRKKRKEVIKHPLPFDIDMGVFLFTYRHTDRDVAPSYYRLGGRSSQTPGFETR